MGCPKVDEAPFYHIRYNNMLQNHVTKRQCSAVLLYVCTCSEINVKITQRYVGRRTEEGIIVQKFTAGSLNVNYLINQELKLRFRNFFD